MEQRVLFSCVLLYAVNSNYSNNVHRLSISFAATFDKIAFVVYYSRKFIVPSEALKNASRSRIKLQLVDSITKLKGWYFWKLKYAMKFESPISWPTALWFSRRSVITGDNVRKSEAVLNYDTRTCRLPHDVKAEQDLSGVLFADRCRRRRWCLTVPGEQRPRVTLNSRHVLPLHATAHHPRCWLFHAEPTILRPSGNDTPVRRHWDYI